jgi:hypothetical protein
MDRDQIAAPRGHANRSAVAYLPEDHNDQLMKLMTAFVPALGILAACALMMAAVAG